MGAGAAAGATLGAVTFAAGLADERALLVSLLVALGVAVGSTAPDIDSDTSVPFHVTFGTLSLSAAAAVLVFALDRWPGDWLYVVGLPLAAGAFVWLAVGWLFRRLTRHRGMVHSIPAAALAGLVAFMVSTRLGLAERPAFLLSAAFVVGYVLHLVLDEVYAAVNFHGLRFAPKRSFGSALKMFSGRRPVDTAVYTAVGVLLYLNLEDLVALARETAAALG